MSKMSDSEPNSDTNGSIYDDPEDNLNVHNISLSNISRRVISNNDVDVDEEQTDRQVSTQVLIIQNAFIYWCSTS